MERADSRRETNAWYDGYMDRATGRPKWTLMDYDSPEQWEAEEDARWEEEKRLRDEGNLS